VGVRGPHARRLTRPLLRGAAAWPRRGGGRLPAHWSVTFAVEDTEAIAEAAAGLGGTIMVPPSDPGVVRTAVLRDPQGAVFSVNSFDPG